MSLAPEQRTYSRKDSVVFRKTAEGFGGLSNMAPGFPLEVNGIRILTTEALYQACRFPHKPEVQRLVVQQGSPMTAKMKSKPHRKDTRDDWDKVRVNIMRWCLRVKLAQNWQKFSELLLATGDRPIVEESRKDDFWGAKAAGEETLVGMNVLGRLLMELREELLSPNRERLRPVELPGVPQLLLYGRPIGIVEACGRARADKGLFGEPLPVGAEQKTTRTGLHSRAAADEPNKEHVEPKVRGELWGNGVISKECKRLAEVDFPIAAVSAHSAREKSIRHGHPSTLHLWWARRPLAACRAVLLSLLWPDPCDPRCPAEFKAKARVMLPQVQGKVGPTDEDLRKALLKFIGDFANWDLSANRSYLEVSRALVKAAHGEEPPLVVDPFAGGGSIPLEALRLGCEAFASDLNPVACLILKAMIEDIPRYGPQLGEELRRVGAEIKRQAEKKLADLYPKDPDGATPLAYLWTRTVRCESAGCGAEIPLARSFWLCKKASRKRALRHRVVRPAGEVPRFQFEIFEPKAEKEVPGGTVTRAKATCVCCGVVLSPERVRAQLVAQRGGANVVLNHVGRRVAGARLLAVVTSTSGESGRSYRLPTERDYEPINIAVHRLQAVTESCSNPLSLVPDERVVQTKVAKNSPFRFHLYGCDSFGLVLSARQQLLLSTLAGLTRTIEVEPAVRDLLRLVVDRVANASTSLCRWHNSGQKLEGMFSRQAISMVWDFAESVPFSNATGSLDGALDWVVAVAEELSRLNLRPGNVQQADAAESRLPDSSVSVWFTDPPYYDAVSYADLSDFFFSWLKRTAPDPQELRDPYDAQNQLTPKIREAIQDDAKTVDGRPKDRAFFERTMAAVFAEGRRVLQDDGVGSVVFAHKTTEGWEALLSGMIRGGWTITASWPIATEMGSRLRARESAALATSVHLICRPRPEDAPVGDWAGVLRELPNRVGDWMERLQAEGIRGADLVFACIGPALEIFSRYPKVETAEGREVALAEYLEKVWEVVGRSALAQVLGTAEAKARNGAAGAVEEDARLTALFLWTLQSTNGETANGESDESQDEEPGDDEDASRGKAKGYTLVFDVVRRFAQPLGIELPKWEGRVIETKKGVVRLLPIAERAKQLFGKDGAQAVAERLENRPIGGSLQLSLFTEFTASAALKGKEGFRGRKKLSVNVGDEALEANAEATTLDRLHVAMLLQSSGRAHALRALLKAEQERGPDFLRLANALSALYPGGSEEKRLLDAMLLAVPR